MRHQLEIIYDHIYNFWPDEALIDKETWMARIDNVLSGEEGRVMLWRLEILGKIANAARDFLKGFDDRDRL